MCKDVWRILAWFCRLHPKSGCRTLLCISKACLFDACRFYGLSENGIYGLPTAKRTWVSDTNTVKGLVNSILMTTIPMKGKHIYTDHRYSQGAPFQEVRRAPTRVASETPGPRMTRPWAPRGRVLHSGTQTVPGKELATNLKDNALYIPHTHL